VDAILRIHPEAEDISVERGAILSMTGPHFGDRYGIACTLMEALLEVQVNPLALGCSIASMCCVVSESQTEMAIEAIKSRFETPEVIEKS
jgi:aspartokinase